MNYSLGKLAPDNSRLSVPFGGFVAVPPVAPIVDVAPDLAYPMDGNDRVGCCVVAGYDHFNQVVTNCLLGKGFNLSQDDIWNFYRTQNPAFDPYGSASTNGPGSSHDNGMSIQLFLEYLKQTGRILGFAKIDHTNEAELKAATYIGLAVMTGVVLDPVQMDQFRDSLTWDFVPGSVPEGGHCIPVVGYRGTPDDITCVTWAKLQNMTQAFVKNQMDEAWFVLTQAHVDHPSFRNHFDLAGFSAAVSEITGGKVSVPVPNHTNTVTIKRDYSDPKETKGLLTAGTFTCETLELPNLGNQHNISCIPEGTYQCIISHFSNMNIDTPELQAVPERTGIRIHPGNYAEGKQVDTEGCILVGTTFADLNHDGRTDIANSRVAFAGLMAEVGNKPFTLTITH